MANAEAIMPHNVLEYCSTKADIKVARVAPLACRLSTLLHAGLDCWVQCGGKPGICIFCGDGACCREGYIDDPLSECLLRGGDSKHVCVRTKETYSVEALQNTSQQDAWPRSKLAHFDKLIGRQKLMWGDWIDDEFETTQKRLQANITRNTIIRSERTWDHMLGEDGDFERYKLPAQDWIMIYCPEVVKVISQMQYPMHYIDKPSLTTEDTIMSICLLKIVRDVCDSLQSFYMIGFGTALAAAVHGAPMLWDDDQDVMLHEANATQILLALSNFNFLQTTPQCR
eukprot:g64245.t1